jgi:hypothetical protein
MVTGPPPPPPPPHGMGPDTMGPPMSTPMTVDHNLSSMNVPTNTTPTHTRRPSAVAAAEATRDMLNGLEMLSDGK